MPVKSICTGRSLPWHDETALAHWRRQHLGFVFQAFHVLPHLTVTQNVALPLLVAGSGCAAAADAGKQIAGVSKVLLADAAVLAHPLAENLTPLVVDLAKQYSHVLAPATTFGKNLLPRVAALLDVAQISGNHCR